ncbi:MAG: 1-aminocyclopropane-1-carboxylate deaminase/D-cysteine desulfhydrase [Cytophagales bacterium]|nr:1-aminocyclopropane-1-carboxylate deaminase/D-cysteine desulfhydrase [Cytophagales bacterium]
MVFSLPSPLNKITHPLLDKHGVTMYVKRDDLIHPEISGNKWRKLKYNFEHVIKEGYPEVVTFGGAYSNHIAATSCAAAHFGIQSTGIIRGDELTPKSNPTLELAQKHGMKFEFVTRENYRKLKVDSKLAQEYYPNAYVIPEGGTNALAIKGVSEIIDEIDIDFNSIITSIGTGGTMAGLVESSGGLHEVCGISSLKGEFVASDFRKLLATLDISFTNYQISLDNHFGGFGKTSSLLIDFINKMKQELNVLFDPIYTGKALFGVWEMIANGNFDGQTLVFLHTGGLQGIVGFNQKSTQKIHI